MCRYSLEERERFIILDLGEELEPSLRAEWKSHLLTCQECRMEWSRFKGIIDKVKELSQKESLSKGESTRMLEEIIQRAGHKRRSILKPAIVLASLLLVVFLGMFFYERNEILETRVAKEDLEVIKNLDLLKELETIEKIVKIVDKEGENHS